VEKTRWTKKSEIKREWHLVDVKDQVLGRVATQIASLLIGKHKVNQVPNIDCGDFVVVINSKSVKLTREKSVKKMYYSHSGFPGGLKSIRFDKLMQKDPTLALKYAVQKMLPKNKLRDTMITRLFIYGDEKHKHEAQKPISYKLNEK